MRRSISVWLATLLFAAACTTSTGSDTDNDDGGGDGTGSEPPAPEDDVIDEAAGEDALKVVEGEMPGVAVIVEFADGLDVDSTTDALASEYELLVTSRYHDLGGAAFIAPDEPTADQLQIDLRVAGIFRDRLIALSPGDAFDAEMAAAELEAESSGEFEAEDRGEEEPGDPVPISRMRPPLTSTGWRLIHAELAAGDGTGTRVAVVDTGIDMHHPDLAGAVADSMGKDCMRRKNKTLYDFAGHGSHVSGIIASQNNDVGTVGVAPGTRIVPVRVLDGEGKGTYSSFLCGLDYVARRRDRIDVVNASLGGVCESSPGVPAPCTDGAPHHKALRNLVARGVTVVVSAGNEGIDADYADPAFIDEIITVSAYLDFNGAMTSRDRYAHFSNFGPGVDIGAPGVRIWSTLPDERYARWNGTSMAAPFVAATAAIIVQTTGAGPEEVRDHLLAAARTSYTGRGGDHPERLLLMPDGGGTCGDSICLGDETDETCPQDCGCMASACDSDGPYGCACRTDCVGDDCCFDSGICPIM